MLIGAHVSAASGLLPALSRGASIGADAVQIFTQSPRVWRPSAHDPETLAAYRAAQAARTQKRGGWPRPVPHRTRMLSLSVSAR